MPDRAIFAARDLSRLRRAMKRAEDLTGRFYCITGREWSRYPYEMKTLAEEEGPPSPAFADVVRVVGGRRRAAGDVDVYRIRLRDDAILSAVEGRSDGIRLYPLLLYVLTHELVHVVRFGSGFARFESDPLERRSEEGKVHGITRGILRPAATPGLKRVFEAYREEREARVLSDCISPK